MGLRPDETDLVGRWEAHDGQVVADAVCRRIEALTKHHLQRVAVSADGWDTLYRDPGDGRHWELTYPDSGLHGGGPPRLTYLSAEGARQKYEAARL
jgi:immunity protein 27 of polymorphic toxin system